MQREKEKHLSEHCIQLRGSHHKRESWHLAKRAG